MLTSRRSRSIVLAVSLLSALALPGTASADHSWGGYHWARTSNPFTVKLGDNVSSTWDSYLRTTSTDWTGSSVLDAPVVAGRSRSVKLCDATVGQVQVCNFKYGDTGWLGVAQIWLSGNHITQGTAKLNDTYFNTAGYNTPGWRNLVMCQEVGHTFGLGHVNEEFYDPNTGSCMDYSADPDGTKAEPDQLSNEHPNQHDYDQLESIYGHLDGTTTVRQSTTGSGADVTSPTGWGYLVASTNGGRTETFVRELGNGVRVVTHVIWAL